LLVTADWKVPVASTPPRCAFVPDRNRDGRLTISAAAAAVAAAAESKMYVDTTNILRITIFLFHLSVPFSRLESKDPRLMEIAYTFYFFDQERNFYELNN
jgi:hypothetical protein